LIRIRSRTLRRALKSLLVVVRGWDGSMDGRGMACRLVWGCSIRIIAPERSSIEAQLGDASVPGVGFHGRTLHCSIHLYTRHKKRSSSTPTSSVFAVLRYLGCNHVPHHIGISAYRGDTGASGESLHALVSREPLFLLLEAPMGQTGVAVALESGSYSLLRNGRSSRRH